MLGDLPQMTEQEAVVTPATRPRRYGISIQQYAALKARSTTVKLATPSRAAAQPLLVASPAPTPAPGPAATKITAFGGLGLGCGHEIPPDMALAAGPSFVLQVINGCVSVFDKNGSGQAGFPKSLASFMLVGAKRSSRPSIRARSSIGPASATSCRPRISARRERRSLTWR